MNVQFYEQFVGQENFTFMRLSTFSQDSRACATTAADVNVARADKNYASDFKKKRTRSSSLITLKYTWNIKENFEMPSDM